MAAFVPRAPAFALTFDPDVAEILAREYPPDEWTDIGGFDRLTWKCSSVAEAVVAHMRIARRVQEICA